MRIAAGVSSSVYRLSGGRIAKIFHSAVSEEMIAREFAAATLAAEAGLPVARPLERRDMPKGRAILFPEVAGQTLMRDMRLRPLHSGSRLRDMALLHRQINACAAPGLRSLRQVLRTDILHGPAAGALQDAALDLLDRLPEGDRLLHGDFHIRNVLLSPAGLVAIDWSKAARGAVTPDLLRAEMLLRFGEGPQDGLTNIARDWAARRYVASYSRMAGEGVQLVPQWRAVVALAWLRARARIRQKAFMRYLNRALAEAGLPSLSQADPVIRR
ncbi:phosphotransferase [Sphingobium sp.]|uniref:phosphotransferase n=1 Tax=Sphingobium sp. TaxID=1912891 RepID=UPI0035C6F45D